MIKQIRCYTQDRYLAGVWDQPFARDLLWSVDDTNKTGMRLLKYRAPSWAWASADRSIYYGIATLTDAYATCAKIQSANLTYATNDDTGLVTAGTAQIYGLLLSARLLSARPYLVAAGSRWMIEVNGQEAFARIRFDNALCDRSVNKEGPSKSLVQNDRSVFRQW